MKILSIETSCDETAVALVEATGDLDNPKFKVLNKSIHSQIEEHKEFGGVYPSLAKREHAKNIVPVTEQCLEIRNSKIENLDKSEILNSKLEQEIEKILEREPKLFENFKKFISENPKPNIDMIAVTSGPGLEPALWVGINFAKALSLAWNIPLLPVNHMEGHIASVLLRQNGKTTAKIEFPALGVLISGGHTELVEITNWNEYKILGKTRDDAIGESYDKVARLLGIPYPGGPEISRLASKFRQSAVSSQPSANSLFPRPMINSDNLDFSFSGLKTAVLYFVQKLTADSRQLSAQEKIEIAGEFEEAIMDVLKNKIGKALNTNEFKTIITAGGVIANQYIRDNITQIAKDYGIKALFPEIEDSTDNAQMIAVAGYFKSFKNKAEINPQIVANGGLTY